MRKQFKWRRAKRGKGEEGEKLFRNGNGNCTLHIQQGIFHGICFNWLIDVLIGKSNCCAEFCRDIFAPPFLAPVSFFHFLFFGIPKLFFRFWFLFFVMLLLANILLKINWFSCLARCKEIAQIKICKFDWSCCATTAQGSGEGRGVECCRGCGNWLCCVCVLSCCKAPK